MKPFFISCAAILFFFAAGCTPKDTFEKQLNSVLPPPGTSDFDLSITLLEISRLFDPKSDTALMNNELQKMADKIKQQIGDEANDEIIVETFNRYIFETETFKYNKKVIDFLDNNKPLTPEEWLEIRLMNKVISRRDGVCSELSYITLMLGEKTGLPICVIGVPGHVYARYQPEGKSPINIEATSSGREYYDYQDKYNPVCRGESEYYGKCMDKREAVGLYLGIIGGVIRDMKDYKKSDLLFKKALELCPKNPGFYWDNAEIHWRVKDYEGAIILIEKALEIDPESSALNAFAGWLYKSINRTMKAEEYLEKALRIDPNDRFAADNLEELKKAR
ncbi:MAG: hypothetical protein CVV21_07975 [Candidatus Goldiibacteriota bacterium HGW-Goldbacteria-1]|jgi:tetratricopeptide (TPR) repeat protein|nr:MAG: hypothetical protein CVV21_07975 [Candidatus Goldiibacteriota bacterium HGW-Goldbacteria-1]